MSSPKEILQQYWGFSAFRPLQDEIVQSVLGGHPTIALLPTGGGKSICFQVPGLVLEGICIVISPLIALMKDQVEQLRKRGIKAEAIYAGMSNREIDIILDNCIYGEIKFLYVSPERIKTELFLERASRMKISMLAVDEAHCISQWGYDFRPPYLKIADFIEELSIERVIALTASATEEVTRDIADKLTMTQPRIFRKSFARFNLSYSVFELENKGLKMLEILKNVKGSSVVYVRSRKRTREVADFLHTHGISADFYHGGLPGEARSIKQERWIHNSTRVMVATNAFGMGIDKPDVRTVIHMDLPDSLEAYYQEAGRAGRDERKAYAVALFDKSDLNELRRWVEKSIVSVDLLKRTYQGLANFYKIAVGSSQNTSYVFDYPRFIKNFNLPKLETFYAISKLADEGLIQLSDALRNRSKVFFLQPQSEVYKFQVSHQRLDFTIKTLMRLYGGELFTTYVSISERDIGQLMKKSPKEVRMDLEYLNEMELVDYQPVQDKPVLTFLTPRFEVNSLPLDLNRLEKRKTVALKKLQSVEEYTLNHSVCRTRMIQQYFDEKVTEDCGICDVCLKRKKKEAELPVDQVLKEVELVALTIEQIQQLLPKLRRESIIDALRYLMEKGDVVLVEEERFASKK